MTEARAPVSSDPRSRVCSGDEKLDALLQGGFLAGSAVILCAAPSEEVLRLLGGFLSAEPNGTCLFISRGAAIRDALHIDSDRVAFLICGERIQPSGNILAGKGLENLTELSLDVSNAVTKTKPTRVGIDILSDLLLRHGALQTRKWLSDQLSRLKSKSVTILAILNPSMHTPAETSSVADLFDGNLEMIEEEVEGRRGKYLRVNWMHGVTLKDREFPLLDFATARLEPPQDRRRVAVLPFQNLSPDPNDEYFADGMTEELISTISRISELSVISRTSVMEYKNKGKRAEEIAKELNVGTFLEGSVRKAASKVRISVQLIDAASDKHLWVETYERNLEDIFALQSEVAENVASSLRVKLTRGDKKRIERGRTPSTEAHLQYLKGRLNIGRWERGPLITAINHFEDALRHDSNYALAYSGLATAWVELGLLEIESPKQAFQKAEQYALRALELDEFLSEAHTALAYALLNKYSFAQVERELITAIDANPSLAEPHVVLALHYLFMNRWDECLRESDRAVELDPLSVRTVATAGACYLYSGHYDKAIEYLKDALEHDPNNSHSLTNLGLAHIQKGMLEDGLAEVKSGVELSPTPSGYRDLAYAYVKANKPEEARRILGEIRKLESSGPIPSTALAGVYAALGEKEKAIEWLERAYDERSGYLAAINCDFVFENLRDEPRFQALIKKMGLKKPM